MERAVVLCEDAVSDIYKMDVFTAMPEFKNIRKELPSSVMNCWEYTGLFGGNIGFIAASYALDDEQQAALQSCINFVVPAYARMDVLQLLSLGGENKCIEEVADENMVELRLYFGK